MGFHGNQPGYNSNHPPQTSPQLSGGSGGSLHMAKWHIPQSAQSNLQQSTLEKTDVV